MILWWEGKEVYYSNYLFIYYVLLDRSSELIKKEEYMYKNSHIEIYQSVLGYIYILQIFYIVLIHDFTLKKDFYLCQRMQYYNVWLGAVYAF